MGSSEQQFAEWDDDRYSVHIDRFDEQHKRLFGLLNDLHRAMNEGHSEEKVGDILRELERYTEYHFGDEEEFMQDCGYAMDCADCFYNHRQMHEEFAERVTDLRERHENGEYITMEVLTFVRDWLDSHIAAGDEDQSYGEYYREELDDYEYDPGTLKQYRHSSAAGDATGSDDGDTVDGTGRAGDESAFTVAETVAGGDLPVPTESMATWFADVAETHGDRTAALVREDGRYTERTFADLSDRARAVAGGLLASGLAPGDRVAILAAPCYAWSVVDLACHLAGLVSVPVYPSFDEERVREILEGTDADGLVAAPGTVPGIDAGDAASELADAAGTVVSIEDLPTDDPRALPGFEAKSDDVATVVYDVDGTARSGCGLTNRNLRAAVATLGRELPLDPGATGTCFLPLAYVYQRVLTYYLWDSGGAVAYIDATDLEDRLAAVQPEVLVGVPKVYQQLYGDLQDRVADMGWMKRKLAGRVAAYGRGIVDGSGTPLKYSAARRLVFDPLCEAFGLANVEYALSGPRPLDDHLVYFFRGLGVPVSEVYGAVGTAGVGTLNPAGSYAPGTVGTPMAGTEFGRTEDGEVLVRGPQVTSEPLGEGTTRAAVRDDWYRTGDDGEFDAAGRLRLADAT